MQLCKLDAQTALCRLYWHDRVAMDEAGKLWCVTREPGKEEKRTIVEKEDVGVDNKLPVCVYCVEGSCWSVRGRV